MGARVLIAVNLGFGLLFAAAFLLFLARPASIERRAQAEIQARVMDAVEQQYPRLGQRTEWTAGVAQQLRERVAKTERWIDSSTNVEAVAQVMASLCRYECGRVASSVAPVAREFLREKVLAWEQREMAADLARIQEWAKGRYERFLDELTTDLRIFTGTNALMCLLAAAAARTGQAGRRWALAISVVLTVSALFGTWLYWFAQNWLQTLLFGSYLGHAYSVLVALVAVRLLALVWLRA